MKLIADLPIKTKIISSLGAMVLLMGSVMMIALSMFSHSTEAEKKMTDHYEEATQGLTDFTENFLLARVWLRDVNLFSKSGNESEINHSIDQFKYFAKKMSDAKAHYIEVTNDQSFYGTRDISLFREQFSKDYQAFENVAVAIFGHITSGNYAEAAKMISEDCHITAGKLIDRIHEAHEMETKYVHENVETAKNNASSTNNIFFAISFSLLTLLCFIIYTTLNKLIVKPITDASAHFSAMAQGGWDLSKKIEVDQKDEIGSLFASLNTFITVLDNLINQVMSSSKNIVVESTGLNQLAKKTGKDLDNQRNLTDLAAVSIDEITSSVKRVAENAENAAAEATKAQGQSDSAATILNAAILSIKNLREQIESSFAVINKLKSESENISQVLDVIKGIAEQTNLLALNAAIEAARAGDHGRGFAVVADEVRTLAQRTQGSTSEIERLIIDLQNGSSSAVKEMEKSQKSADDATEQAANILSAMDEILASISLISRMNGEIATTTVEQSLAVEGVSQNIQDIKTISEKTGQGSEATNQSGVSLSKLSVELEDQLVLFKR